MTKLTTLALTIGGILLASNVSAANHVADARGNAMGNTGVASADYLTAPFYNPALATSFKNNDDFGLLIAVGVAANDPDDNLTTLDDLQSAIDDYEDSGSTSLSTASEIEAYLDDLNGNDPLSVNVGLGVAIALPTNMVSTNLFVRGYTEIVADTVIEDSGSTTDKYTNSKVNLLAFGYAEIGLALAKEVYIDGEKVSFGITPKYQQMTTYAKSVSVNDFEIDDYDESENTKNAFNFDLGAVWYTGDFRAAVAVKDLFAQEIKAEDTSGAISDTYNLDTQVTVGVAYSSDYFVAAVDADLTKQERFEHKDDDTQFVRFGIEGNAWGWAQLRAGYEMDLEDTLDNSITAGIGLSPFDVVNIDVAGSYAGESQLGGAVNLAFTF